MAKLLSHQLLGVAIVYYVLKPQNIIQAFLYGGLALTGSMVPDLDGLHGHRTLLHNVFACILTSVVVYIALSMINYSGFLPLNMYPGYSSIAYMLAYTSHLLADIPTGTGVTLFYPLSRKKIGILGLKYDNLIYNGLLIAAATLLLYAFFTHKPLSYISASSQFSFHS